jgi:osmoprotectant transport system ATP-binding protein
MTEPALTDVALEARNVTCVYGRTTALDGVSIAVRRGQILALVGESGSGKTTLLRCFNRMVEPDGGEIVIGGRPAREADAVALRRHTGYVPQEGGLLPHWNVARNVALVPSLLGWADASEHARRALDLVGLPATQFGARRPSALSGGQRQRVAIARALAARPPVVLLDEPFGALDAITRAELQDAFLQLRRQLELTAILVTHDLREAMRLADRIAVLRAGHVEQEANPRILIAEPATDYVRELLAKSHASEADLQ